MACGCGRGGALVAAAPAPQSDAGDAPPSPTFPQKVRVWRTRARGERSFDYALPDGVTPVKEPAYVSCKVGEKELLFLWLFRTTIG